MNLRKTTLDNLKDLRKAIKGKTIDDKIDGYNNPVDYKLDTYEETHDKLKKTGDDVSQIEFKEDTRETSSHIMDFSSFIDASNKSKFNNPSFGKNPKVNKKIKDIKNPLNPKLDTKPMKHGIYI